LFPRHPLHWPGLPAVIVFFVLSGFVIAFVTDGRDRTLAGYALNRLSRLWSVALPALGFGLILSRFVAIPFFWHRSLRGMVHC
jgi:peptidoglycan/LPS O-acetylase OafA/YrhL